LRLDVLQKITGVGLPVAIRLVLVADGLGATQGGGVQIGDAMGSSASQHRAMCDAFIHQKGLRRPCSMRKQLSIK
jgi:hypothetical protein